MHHKPPALLALPAWYAEQGLCNDRVSVRPSVWSIVQPPLRRAAGLLLSAPRTEHIDRQRRQPAPSSTALSSKCRSVLLTAELATLNTDLFYGIAGPWMSYENKQYSEI